MRRFGPRLIVLFAAFVLLGLPEGVLGTAWPSMRASLGQPEAALAQLLIAYTVGYLVSSIVSGNLADRLGTDPAIRLGVAATAVGLAIYAFAPVWALTLFAGFALGIGGGIVDATINAEIALRHDQRTMNLLHAAWGIGATLGPLFVTALLAISVSWRIAYVVLLIAEVAVLISLKPGGAARTADGDGDIVGYADQSRRPMVVLGCTLVYFALYVGAEISIGQWSFSVLTERRGVGTTAAGIAVAAYWGGLTVGRLLLGVLNDRLHPMTLLRGSGVVAFAATVWFWADVTGSLIALPIIGLAFAGVFPALVLMTSSWLPERLVTRAVGWQLAASSGGAIIAAAVLGTVASSQGLDATVTAMVVIAGAMVLAHVATEIAATR